VLFILAEVKGILAEEPSNVFIRFSRVYIPKTNIPNDDRKRPLGVPDLSDRVYLSMLNYIISFIRVDNPSTLEQHGYITQKNILTAWKSILSYVDKFSYVYEFDLKGFFDNVPLRTIYEILSEDYGCPPDINNLILKLCLSRPILTNNDIIPEPSRVFSLGDDRKESTHLLAHLLLGNVSHVIKILKSKLSFPLSSELESRLYKFGLNQSKDEFMIL